MSQQNLSDPSEIKPTNIFVWLCAVLPLAFLAIQLAVQPFEIPGRLMWFPHWLLLGADAWRIHSSWYCNRNTGEVVDVDGWMWLGLILLFPLYLFRRARVVGDGYWYAIVWLASIVFVAAALAFIVDDDPQAVSNSDIVETTITENRALLLESLLTPTATAANPHLGSLYATVTANDERKATALSKPESVPTSQPKPTSTPRPRYTPTPDYRNYGRSRSQPMPKGRPIELADGTAITVESVTENANQVIKRHDAWTEPPPSGHQFLLVNIEVSNEGDEPIGIYMVNELSLVGKSNVSYDGWNDCWTFPNEIDTGKTIFPSGSLSGNICFTVKSSDVDSLVMYYEVFNLIGDNYYVYWALE